MPGVPEKTTACRSKAQSLPSLDARTAAVAAKQHGQIAARQLIALGASHAWIRRRALAGRLHATGLHGVYSVGHERTDRFARYSAAVLAAGEGALLDGIGALNARSLPGAGAPATPLVTVEATGRPRRRGLILRTSKLLTPADRDRAEGIPVTSIPFAFLGLAETLPYERVRSLFDAADRKDKIHQWQFEELLARANGRRGVRVVNALLERRVGLDIKRTRSEMEVMLLELCRSVELPIPEVNPIVDGIEVDALWRAQRLIVELDSFEFHRDRTAFDRDRKRDLRLKRAGWEILRITWTQLRGGPDEVAAAISALLLRG